MERMDRFLPLDAEPSVQLASAPRIGVSDAELVEAVHADLLRRPGGFDGPILMATEYSPQLILAYPSRYSAGVAATRGARTLGLGLLGVKLWLEQDGKALWQLRAPRVFQGGTWDLAVAGAVEPGQTPRQAVVREAREELGISAADLVGLTPRLLAASPGDGVVVIYGASLREGATLIANPEEVADLRWGSTSGAPGPLCTCAAAIHGPLLASLARP